MIFWKLKLHHVVFQFQYSKIQKQKGENETSHFDQNALSGIVIEKNEWRWNDNMCIKQKYYSNRSCADVVINPSRPNPRRREKINLNSYFHTSLLCLKRFVPERPS